MGFFKSAKSNDKVTSSHSSSHYTETTGPAVAYTSKGGSGTYAEKGGRAAAATRHGTAWSKSVAYGGDSDDDERDQQVSISYTFKSGNAKAGVIKGGSFASAGAGEYGGAGYIDGSRFSTSIAYGGDKKGDAIQFR